VSVRDAKVKGSCLPLVGERAAHLLYGHDVGPNGVRVPSRPPVELVPRGCLPAGKTDRAEVYYSSQSSIDANVFHLATRPHRQVASVHVRQAEFV
jgi:hypothetical protein